VNGSANPSPKVMFPKMNESANAAGLVFVSVMSAIIAFQLARNAASVIPPRNPTAIK